MNKSVKIIKDLIVRKRGLSVYFMIAAFVFSLVTVIVYANTGITVFNPELSGTVIALFVLVAVFSAIFSVFEVKLGKYAVYIMALAAWLLYIGTQVNYLANLIASIDGETMSSGFVLTIIFGALTWIVSLVSAILQKYELCSKKYENVQAVSAVIGGDND